MNKLRILVTNPVHKPTLEPMLRDPGLEITVRDEPSGGHGIDLLEWPADWLREKDILFCTGVFPKNFREMNAMDVHYARRAAPLLDLGIMLLTPVALIGQMADCMARRRKVSACRYATAVTEEPVLGYGVQGMTDRV